MKLSENLIRTLNKLGLKELVTELENTSYKGLNYLDIDGKLLSYVNEYKVDYDDLAALLYSCETENKSSNTFMTSDLYSSNAMKMKPTRLLRKILKRDLPHATQEAILAELKMEDYDIVVVSGEQIIDVYNWRNYGESVKTGSLAKSCMRYDECLEWLDVYCTTAKAVAIIGKSTKQVYARAILWDNVVLVQGETESRIKLMDRAYGSTGLISVLLKWAAQNGYYTKESQDILCTRVVSPEGVAYEAHTEDSYLYVTPEESFEFYPFMDTFYFKFFNSPVLYSKTFTRDLGEGYFLTSTDGNEVAACDCCGAMFYRNDLHCLDEAWWCDDCADSEYEKFHDNGDYITADADVQTCESCLQPVSETRQTEDGLWLCCLCEEERNLTE
jgi:hypothetical protein